MYNIYYAHHRWKYGTQIESYEVDLIKRYFPDDKIFNPSKDIETPEVDGEEAVMKECLETVRNSDILVFSSMDGVVGTGVYHEIEEARKFGKYIYYIFNDKLFTDFEVTKLDDDKRTDRLYAIINNKLPRGVMFMYD